MKLRSGHVTKGPSRRNGPAISANDAARPARRQRASPMLNLMTTVMLNVVVNPHLISRVERSVAEVEASRASAASAAQQKEEEEVEVELEDSKKKKSIEAIKALVGDRGKKRLRKKVQKKTSKKPLQNKLTPKKTKKTHLQ
jgi:hypothetical protein